MKKSVSISRICLVVCIIILIGTAIVTSTLGSLLPVFCFVALLDVIPLVKGNRTQKIVAAVILTVAVTLVIFAFGDYRLERQRLEKMRKTHIQQRISPGVQSVLSFHASFSVMQDRKP